MRRTTLALCLLGVLDGPVQAQRAQLAKETVEAIAKRFGQSAVREGTQALAIRLESLAARYGDDVFRAAKQVGPRVFQVLERVGEKHATQALGVMAKHGEAGVVHVLSRPRAMNLLVSHGDDAARVLVRHPGGITEPVIEQVGGPAIRALGAVGPQSGRRMVMLASEGQLARIGRTPELMDVVFRFGDRGMDFIWKNKETLAIGTVLVAFLADPEAFITGARDLAHIAGEHVIHPAIDNTGGVVKEVAREAAAGLNWTLIAFAAFGAVLLPVAWKYRHRLKPLLAGLPDFSPPPITAAPPVVPPPATQAAPPSSNQTSPPQTKGP